MESRKSEDKYSIGLFIGKIEFDGNEISDFSLLDYKEIVLFNELESKLNDFYNSGLEKIKKLKKQLKERVRCEY